MWSLLGAKLRLHNAAGFSCAPSAALLALVILLSLPAAQTSAVARDTADRSQTSDANHEFHAMVHRNAFAVDIGAIVDRNDLITVNRCCGVPAWWKREIGAGRVTGNGLVPFGTERNHGL